MNTLKKLNFIGVFALLVFYSCSRKVTEKLVVQFSKNPINIKISSDNSGLGPCEPSICINPINKDIIIAGSILDRVHISNDGGKTWKETKLRSPYGVFGDPVVRIGPKGRIYYSHLSNPTGKAYNSVEFLDRIVVQTSIDGGNTFDDGHSPDNDRLKDQDKQWLYIDPIDGSVLMSWTEFDLYNSKDPKDKSRILFSQSTDGAKTWSPPIDISDIDGDCLDDDMTTEGAVPVKDEAGNIYVTWAYGKKIYLDKSSDGGKTWLDNDIEVADQFEGWALDIPGINRCNGFPILGVDRSGGKHNGNLYINWSDQLNGKDDTDIWLLKSSDGGKSWSKRLRVNDDLGGKHQFFSWMTVDPVTGYIYIVFYDRRAYTENQTDVYLAYSTDGGSSFTNKKISDRPFIPDPLVFFGDYNDISAYDGMVRPIWTRYENKELSIWTAIINVR